MHLVARFATPRGVINNSHAGGDFGGRTYRPEMECDLAAVTKASSLLRNLNPAPAGVCAKPCEMNMTTLVPPPVASGAVAAGPAASDGAALRVLIIEDDVEAARAMAEDLTRLGLAPTAVHDGREALQTSLSGTFDVLIIDRMLPGCDGLSLLQQLRDQGLETPALFLTAMGSVADRVAGLQGGGDDYVVKPIDSVELHARVQALARRGGRAVAPMLLTFGDLELDRLTRTARRRDGVVQLLPLEYRLLEVLMLARGQPLTRKMLLEEVWRFRFDPRTNIVETHICRLRAKLEAVGPGALIQTIRGAGYALVEL